MEIIEFIKRRFPSDSNWCNGNCYYFALILHDRFGGAIYYDVIDGHFCLHYDGHYYDWRGEYSPIAPIKWEDFEEYDMYQKERIMRDCLK